MSASTTASLPASQSHPATLFLDALKTRQQATWASADFGRVGVTLQIVGETLCEAADIIAGDRVLDVAAGNGNASLAAARRFADVTSTDFVPDLLQQGQRRADADGLSVAFQPADVEQLPFDDGTFDAALSTFGVMFAPNQERAAAELLRVVRPGGRIGLANWTPEGFVGQLFTVMSRFVPPPAGLRSPMDWGTETRLVELFGPVATDIHTHRRRFMFRYRSTDHWIEFFERFYGPTTRAFAAVGAEGRASLRTALTDLLLRSSDGRSNTLVIPAEYLEVVVTK